MKVLENLQRYDTSHVAQWELQSRFHKMIFLDGSGACPPLCVFLGIPISCTKCHLFPGEISLQHPLVCLVEQTPAESLTDGLFLGLLNMGCFMPCFADAQLQERWVFADQAVGLISEWSQRKSLYRQAGNLGIPDGCLKCYCSWHPCGTAALWSCKPQPGTAGKLLLNSVVLLGFASGSTTGLKPEHKSPPGSVLPRGRSSSCVCLLYIKPKKTKKISIGIWLSLSPFPLLTVWHKCIWYSIQI